MQVVGSPAGRPTGTGFPEPLNAQRRKNRTRAKAQDERKEGAEQRLRTAVGKISALSALALCSALSRVGFPCERGQAMNGRNVLIGVSGGIAAFKTAALVSRLVQAGAGAVGRHDPRATRLIGPKTFEALTSRPVRTSVFGPGGHPHIDLAQAAEVFCIAPATANVLAKAACGLADDLLSATLLSFDGPVIMAPAMNDKMWQKPAVAT